MNDRRRGKPQAWSWTWLPLGAFLYATLALTLLTLGLEPIGGTGLRVPPWAVITIPVLVYVVLALGSLGRHSAIRAAVGFLALATLHALVVASTGALISLVEPVGYVRGVQMVVRELPTLACAQLVVVPLMLAPLRRLLVPASRPTRPARPAAAPRVVAPPNPRPAPAAPAAPDSPPPRPQAPARAAVPAPAAAPTPVAAPAAAASAAAPRETARVEAPAVTPVAPHSERSADADIAAAAARAASPGPAPTRESLEDAVRIPFARIANQLPADAFLLPLDRVAANLLEPGHVLVPRRLLTPQLADGAAHVTWDVVAEQFPREALALTGAELAQRLPHGRLDLPLDEIVVQMPPELFALSSTTVNVRGIEEFPPPFQPHGPPPSSPRATTAQLIEPFDAPPAVEEPEPLEPGPAAAEPAHAVEPAPASAAAVAEPMAPEARVAALLAPSLGVLAVDTVTVNGATLIVAAAPSRARADVVDTAARALRFLADARLPALAEQLTVRTDGAALVLTPLGADAALATVPASSGSLALLERLALRAAMGTGREARDRAAAAEPDADGLRDVAVPEHVRAVAGSLQAFGPVSPTVLRDDEGTVVYLFLPSPMDPRPLGAFARDLARALDGAALGDMSAATVRFGAQCLVIRALTGTVARTTLLVTGGGPVARPGLARLELERAALRLGTL